MQWYYAKGGQRHGPITEEALKKLAASGQLAPSDLVWRKGMAQWTKAIEVAGLFVTPTPSSPPSPPSPVAATAAAPALWNPKWLGAWSLLLSWAFGAFLLAKNWKALGEPGKARRAMVWFYASFPWLLLLFLLPDASFLGKIWEYGWLVILAAFCTVEVNPQIKLVKARFGDQYTRKSWLKPLGIGAVTVVGSLVICLILALAIEQRSEDFGEHVRVGQNTLFYQAPVTKSEAEGLGNYLVSIGVVSKDEKVFRVAKSGHTYEFHTLIKAGLEHDSETLDEMRSLARLISQNVFGGAEVDVHLCDANFNTLRVVVP